MQPNEIWVSMHSFGEVGQGAVWGAIKPTLVPNLQHAYEKEILGKKISFIQQQMQSVN